MMMMIMLRMMRKWRNAYGLIIGWEERMEEITS
jgi:hypothetical protein